MVVVAVHLKILELLLMVVQVEVVNLGQVLNLEELEQ